MSIAASDSAATATMPIFSSDQASERVRGMSANLPTRETPAMYGSVAAAARSSEALPSKAIWPSFSMMNSASSAFRAVARSNPISPPWRGGRVLGDEERVAQLVRDDDRADAFEIAQLDDLLVDRQRR